VCCKLHNLIVLKTFFINGSFLKYILDLNFFKNVRLVGTLIKLRGVNGFDVLPFTS
jgi:hypothetical protein